MLADLSTAFIAVLPQIIWNVTISFHGGPVICKFLRFLQVSVDLAEKQHDRPWLPLTAVSCTTDSGCRSQLSAVPQSFLFLSWLSGKLKASRPASVITDECV